jgi:hypothetical protein
LTSIAIVEAACAVAPVQADNTTVSTTNKPNKKLFFILNHPFNFLVFTILMQEYAKILQKKKKVFKTKEKLLIN